MEIGLAMLGVWASFDVDANDGKGRDINGSHFKYPILGVGKIIGTNDLDCDVEAMIFWIVMLESMAMLYVL